MNFDRDLLAMYRDMQRIRASEKKLSVLFAENLIPGFIHSSIGQEAVPVGVMHGLEPGDTIASNHRGHGHSIAKGLDLGRFFAEIMGRSDGYCAGRGGSMHVADAAIGMLGANGIVGAGLSIAVGNALAHQVKQTGKIAVVFFGDGAMCEGLLHECLNIAKLWKLPLLFVCENNGWSEFTPTRLEFMGSLPKLADAFDLPCRTIDGNDASAVLAATRELSALARDGLPSVLEAHTNRWGGHFEGDQQKYRDADDLAAAIKNDPIQVAEQMLLDQGVRAEELADIRRQVDEDVERGVTFASASAEPEFEAAFADVYTTAVTV